MWSNKKSKVLCIALFCSLTAGCATPEETQQATGSAISSAIGAAIGYAVGGTKGAVIGAGIGLAAGWTAVKISQYNATQVRSASEDQQIYGLTKPVKNTVVKIRKGTAAPASVRPGQQVTVVTDYSLEVPQGVSGSEVVESWVLKKDGQVLTNVAPQRIHRDGGGYAVDATIPIPANAKPGTYVVETKVQAGTSYDVNQAVFVVAS